MSELQRLVPTNVGDMEPIVIIKGYEYLSEDEGYVRWTDVRRLLAIEAAARELVAYSNHEADMHASICEHLMGPPGPFPCDCDAPRLIDDLRKALWEK